MKIATWNLESTNRLTPARKAAFLDAMENVGADIWVLTESWTHFLPPSPYRLVAQSCWAEDLTPDRCWVAIWVKKGLSAKRQDIHTQQDRMACCRIGEPGQQDIVVVGTVLPWSSDPRWPGATGFCTALAHQVGEWKRLRGSPPTAALVVAGDFNQSVPHQRPYGSKTGWTALSEMLPLLSLNCLTSGSDQHTGKPRIDHIYVSHTGLPSPVDLIVDSWTVPVIGSKPITDHVGVFADLH